MSNSKEEELFQDSEEVAKEQQKKRGIKLDSNKSKIKPKPEELNFEKRAGEVVNKIQQLHQRAAILSKSYWAMIMDKTLKKNKGPIQSNLEQETLNNLINYAREINVDDTQVEGDGSVAMVTLLFKTSIYFRDKYNEIEYKTQEMQKSIDDLSNRLGAAENEIERLQEKLK